MCFSTVTATQLRVLLVSLRCRRIHLVARVCVTLLIQCNMNPIMHPAGILMNAGRIEYSKGDFYFYKEGVTVIDPDNTRKGISRLKTVLREIASDIEAANWTSSLQ